MHPLAIEAKAAGLNFWKLLLTATALFIFICALWSAVAFFIGYASRINMTSDAQREGNQSIDYIFMRIAELERDELALNLNRGKLENLNSRHISQSASINWEINSSVQYSEYYAQLSELRDEIELRSSLVAEHYLKEMRSINFVEPSLEHSQLFGRLEFRSEASAEGRTALLDFVRPRQANFRSAITNYLAQFKGRRELLEVQYQHALQNIHNDIEAIVKRSPQVASDREREFYKVKPNENTENTVAIDQLRAVLRSYKVTNATSTSAPFDFLRFDRIVQLPTIVLTMFVTLFMGLLGGIVSFLRLMVENPERYTLTELFRRSTLGVAAATGVFLLAGSGLLILTAQSSKAFTPTSIELSPYFVAFLAFISGFMADDAFARLTEAGRSIFKRNGAAQDPPSNPPAPNPEQPAANANAPAPAGQ